VTQLSDHIRTLAEECSQMSQNELADLLGNDQHVHDLYPLSKEYAKALLNIHHTLPADRWAEATAGTISLILLVGIRAGRELAQK